MESFDVPGDPGYWFATKPVEVSIHGFFSLVDRDGSSFLTKWRFAFPQPASTGLSIGPGADHNLLLRAVSAADAKGVVDKSTDLRTWSVLTNYVGSVEIPIPAQRDPQEFFRRR